MGDATGSRLRPYPVPRHAEALGDLVGGQQAGHDTQADGRRLRAIELRKRLAAKLVSNWYPGAAETLRQTRSNGGRHRHHALTPKPRVCGAFGAVGDGAVTVIVGG